MFYRFQTGKIKAQDSFRKRVVVLSNHPFPFFFDGIENVRKKRDRTYEYQQAYRNATKIQEFIDCQMSPQKRGHLGITYYKRHKCITLVYEMGRAVDKDNAVIPTFPEER